MMESFYSVLYIRPEPASEEKIAVGLLLNANSKPYFDYSDEKLKVAARMVDSESIDSLEKMLRNIKKKTESALKDENQFEAFELYPFDESYFNYLNRYSNNFLIYSKPSENRGAFSKNDFNELFRLLVDKKYEIKEKKEVNFKDRVKRTIKASRVQEKVDVFYRIPKESVRTIYRDHEVDYIGVNGGFISGNSLDMESDPYHAENKLYLLRVLVDGLQDLAKKLDMKNQGKHIIFYNDPVGNKNKELLHDASKDETSPLTYKHWDEFDGEERWILNNNRMKKFSELELTT